jgi:aspartate-semialdehyde dehydrogenase
LSRGYDVAILGATGLVGRTMARILEEHRFPVRSIKLLASKRSAGTKLCVLGQEVVVEEATAESFKGVEIALFSAGSGTSKELAPVAARAGAVVIDNSKAWRMDKEVPLVVPEVNPEDVDWHNGIIANPNCSTIQMVVALNPLHRANPIRRVVVDTYQSVGGTGGKGQAELREQVSLMAAGRDSDIMPSVYPHQIAGNLVPEIDEFLEDGSTLEEMKMVKETHKIMHAPEIRIVATTVRVPVYSAHSEAIHLDFSRPMSVLEARRLLCEAPGVVVEDEPSKSRYPTPLAASGRDEVFVGRIRSNDVFDNGLSMWVVADNVRKGAATNAVQIAETLVQRGRL